MVNENSCITSLNLSLAVHEFHRNHDQVQGQYPRVEQKSMMKLNQSLPSLSLGLGEDYQDPINMIDPASNSTVRTVSSSSNSMNGKRERVGGGEEAEKVSSKAVSDIDQDKLEGGARKKLRLTKEQSFVLEENFKRHSTLNPKQKQSLAKSLDLLPRQVEVWFQNRRARTKLKQNEVDCALLKRCCEALRNDNTRLKKEIEELKAVKTTADPSQFYMQFPAANHNMCPSCERIVSGGSDGQPVMTPHKSFKGPYFHSTQMHRHLFDFNHLYINKASIVDY